MTIITRVISYLFWIVIAFLASFSYARIILGPKPKNPNFFESLYDLTTIYIGTISGSIIAVVFILCDIFCLSRKLKNKKRAISLRLLTIIVLTIIIGTTHYLLEKVFDII